METLISYLLEHPALLISVGIGAVSVIGGV